MASKRRSIPEVNAASMADISFILLIFFIVATTLDSDKGIFRRLPPYQKVPPKIDVKERNVLMVHVNRENKIMLQGKITDIRNVRAIAKEFIANPYDRPDLPEKKPMQVEYFGTVMVTKDHVISIQNDRGTSYGTYIAVQNELTAAYNELKNELALKKFGIKYDDMKEEDPRRKAIEKIYPLKISEAEPKNIGGQ